MSNICSGKISQNKSWSVYDSHQKFSLFSKAILIVLFSRKMETDAFKFEAETSLDPIHTKVTLSAHAEFIAIDFAIE